MLIEQLQYKCAVPVACGDEMDEAVWKSRGTRKNRGSFAERVIKERFQRVLNERGRTV
jgi:hypothetical protein